MTRQDNTAVLGRSLLPSFPHRSPLGRGRVRRASRVPFALPMANDSDRKKGRVDRKTFRGFGPDAQKFAGDDESLAEKVAAKGFDRDNEGRKKR